MVLDLDPQATNFVIIKVGPDNLPATSARIEKVWNRYDPEQTFEAKLLDEILDMAFRLFYHADIFAKLSVSGVSRNRNFLVGSLCRFRDRFYHCLFPDFQSVADQSCRNIEIRVRQSP